MEKNNPPKKVSPNSSQAENTERQRSPRRQLERQEPLQHEPPTAESQTSSGHQPSPIPTIPQVQASPKRKRPKTPPTEQRHQVSAESKLPKIPPTENLSRAEKLIAEQREFTEEMGRIQEQMKKISDGSQSPKEQTRQECSERSPKKSPDQSSISKSLLLIEEQRRITEEFFKRRSQSPKELKRQERLKQSPEKSLSKPSTSGTSVQKVPESKAKMQYLTPKVSHGTITPSSDSVSAHAVRSPVDRSDLPLRRVGAGTSPPLERRSRSEGGNIQRSRSPLPERDQSVPQRDTDVLAEFLPLPLSTHKEDPLKKTQQPPPEPEPEP